MTTPKDAPPLRALVVSDEEADEARFRALTGALPGSVTFEWTGTFESALDAMTAGGFDAYLVACRLGGRSGLDLLRAYRAAAEGAPVIMLSDGPERGVDLQAMENGAADFLVEPALDAVRLERSIRYAVENARRAAALRGIRDELEARVAERTAALETLNEALGAEVAERRAAERALDFTPRALRQALAAGP